ncbi:MAG: hypothetical protein H7301_05240 [Cryobacterium sp.]|nr:hypothetical protein [Oligoflexia bacterium]
MRESQKKSIFNRRSLLSAWLLGLSFLGQALAADAPKAAPTKPAASGKVDAANKGFRKKELNFEERVIEGLSNKGYESLSQTGSADGLKGEKLYRKRAEFDDDSKSLLREMEYMK